MNPKDIQRLLAQTRQDLGQRYAQIPQTISQFPTKATDPQYQSLMGNKNQKIMELYEHDKRLADTYANPQSDLYMEDPYARERARAVQAQATGGEIVDIGQQMAQRGNVLQDAMEQSMRLMEYGLRAKELEAQLLQKEFQNLLDLEQLAMQRKESEAKTATTNPDLRAFFDSLMQLQQGAKAGDEAQLLPGAIRQKTTGQMFSQGRKLSHKDEMRKIGKKLSRQYPNRKVEFTQMPDGSFEIIAVPEGQKYATPEQAALSENQRDIAQQLLAAQIASQPKLDLEAQRIFEQFYPKDVDEKPEVDEIKTTFSNVMDGLDNFISEYKRTSAAQRLNPLSPFGVNVQTQKELLAIFLGKLVENDRMSDQDRQFYLKQFPVGFEPEAIAVARIEGIKKAIRARLGLTQPQLMDPSNGMVYKYNSELDPDYIEDQQRGFIKI